jgi:hypothetical protein
MKFFQRFQKLVLACLAVIFALASLPVPSKAQQSTGIIIESVNDYGACCSLSNSIANGDGFKDGVVFPGSRYYLSSRWTDATVYDTDFADPQINSLGKDNIYFDKPGTAISYFTGHGIGNSGCSTTSCTSTSQCTNPTSGGGRLPGSCRFSPLDNPRCCYMVDRMAVVQGTFANLNNQVNYTGGPIRWGESPQSGGWAGAGTDGGTNVVVLDISHGILPTFWYQTLVNANAGVQLIGTLMTAGGDTANVPQRGSTFASFYRANENTRVSDGWLNTMNSLPSNLGSSCPGGGGGHGFNGCGCHIIFGMDKTADRAAASMTEGWVHITQDSNDALGNQFYSVRWLCNYPFSATNQSAWEKP